MTIIDFPRGGRVAARSAAAHALQRFSPTAQPLGEPPSGAWLVAYEELAACCAEVVAASPVRIYDAEWEELVDWIRSRLAVLDDLKADGAS
jgi:hypothetical protein